jgi:hypothetical protein
MHVVYGTLSHLRIRNGKMVFAKLKNFFAKLIFFPPNFFLVRKISLFQNTKKSFGGEKINLAKKHSGNISYKWMDKIFFCSEFLFSGPK